MSAILTYLRNRRRLLDLSQAYMSERLGISTKAYSKIENGQSKLDTERFEQICQILDVHPANVYAETTKVSPLLNKNESSLRSELLENQLSTERKLFRARIEDLKKHISLLEGLKENIPKKEGGGI